MGLAAPLRILILIIINVRCTNENTGFYTPIGPTHPQVLNVIMVLLALKRYALELRPRHTHIFGRKDDLYRTEKATNKTAKNRLPPPPPLLHPAVITTQPVRWDSFRVQQQVRQVCTSPLPYVCVCGGSWGSIAVGVSVRGVHSWGKMISRLSLLHCRLHAERENLTGFTWLQSSKRIPSIGSSSFFRRRTEVVESRCSEAHLFLSLCPCSFASLAIHCSS